VVSLQSSLSILFKKDKVILTHLGKGLTRYTLIDYEAIDLSRVEDRSDEHIDMLVQNGISHFLEEHHIKPDSVLIGIPRKTAFFTFAELPRVQGVSLEEIVSYEIERHVPLPADSVCFDAQVVERHESQNGMLKVAIIAARRDLILRYAGIVEQIGLAPSAITVSTLGLVDFFTQFGEPRDDATCALVDCDDGSADVVILRGKELMHCRTIDLRHEGLSSSWQRLSPKRTLLGEKLIELGLITEEQLQLALTEQEKAGNTPLGQILFHSGFISEDDLAKALSDQAPVAQSALGTSGVDKEADPAVDGAESLGVQEQGEVKKAQAILGELASYVDENGGNVYIDELYLSGEYRSAVNLQGALVELGFAGRVRLLQPHQKIRSLVPPERASSLCSAIGLGMRDFEEKMQGANLLPAERRPRRKLYGKRFMIALSISLCVLLVAIVASSIMRQKMEINFFESKVQSLRNEVNLISATRRQIKAWDDLLKGLKSISEETLNPLLVLKELDRTLPSDGPEKVWLTNFRLKGQKLSISGRSAKPEEILAKLEASPIFKNARFEGRITSGKDSERFSLVVEVDIKNQWQLLKEQESAGKAQELIGPVPAPEDMLIGPGENNGENGYYEGPDEVPQLPFRVPEMATGMERTFQSSGPELPFRNPLLRGPAGQMFDNRLPATGSAYYATESTLHEEDAGEGGGANDESGNGEGE